ncbi:MAG: hypothetical protein D6689_16280 [Deltaproteobacteria bacterium]|nr:MAG: hypothetical protein D6689_16280 [Deltaproteobacteria bacterium]
MSSLVRMLALACTIGLVGAAAPDAAHARRRDSQTPRAEPKRKHTSRQRKRAARKHRRAARKPGRAGRKRTRARHAGGARRRARAGRRQPAPKRETVRARGAATLHAEAAESSAVVVVAEPGATMDVLERRGRWLRVRVMGADGWVTRTSIASPNEPRAQPARRRWAQRRTDQWRPEDARSPERATADEGGRGWAGTARDRFAPAAPAPASGRSTPMSADRTPDPPDLAHDRAALPRWTLATSASVGFLAMSMDLTTNIEAGLGNYVVAANAAAASGEVSARYALTPRWLVGADARYAFGVSRPGIHYEPSAGGPAGDVAFATHEVRGAAEVGASFGDAARPIDVLARGGYLYRALLVDDIDNVAHMPSESLRGAIVGAGVRAYRVAGDVNARVDVDALAGGTRAQTQNLEDGTEPSVSAVWVTARMDTALAAGMRLTLGYRFERATTRWSGPSRRVPDAMDAVRTDTAHLVTAGVSLTL